MATAKATLSNFRQAPRKMRMVANLVRGKKVSDVLVNLDFVAKKASAPIKTLINSALSNAKALDIPTENLIVKTIFVNGGPIMYRRRPAARGSAHPIRKRISSITVELGEAESKKKNSPKQSESSKTSEATASIEKPKAIKTRTKSSTVKAKATK
jgi:large subunit ribosomal protein L22